MLLCWSGAIWGNRVWFCFSWSNRFCRSAALTLILQLRFLIPYDIVKELFFFVWVSRKYLKMVLSHRLCVFGCVKMELHWLSLGFCCVCLWWLMLLAIGSNIRRVLLCNLCCRNQHFSALLFKGFIVQLRWLWHVLEQFFIFNFRYCFKPGC